MEADSSIRSCCTALASGIRPEPDMLISEWAQEFRVLTQTSAAEPGRWRNERTPYLIEPMDALSVYSGVEQVSVLKGAQGGWTEMSANAIGYFIHKAPGPMMYIQPTVDTVKRFSRTRLAPMIEACAPLRERIDSKSRDSANTVQMKDFPGGVLILGGANSAAALRSAPIRVLLMDEVDAYPQDVDGEGDPIELAEKRTSTFRNRKILKFGTPTIAGFSHIEKAYKAGDMRQWHVPCPHCKKSQVLHWRFDDDQAPGGLVWKPGRPETARYQCQFCLKLIDEHNKTWMNNNGIWIPSRTEGVDPKIRSYHWPSLYSPYGWPGSSWAELAKKWDVGHKDPTKLKAFFNLELGLPYEDKASRSAEPHVLLERCEIFPDPKADGTPVVPNEVALITAGVDVQNNRIEYEIVGWGKGEESFSLATGVISGDTSTPVPFNDLDRVLLQRFRNVAGVELTIRAACVDSNFNTQMVTSWCGPRLNRKVWAIRGMAGPRRPIWPKMPGYSQYNRTPLYSLGVDPAKEAVVGRLNIAEPGPGYCHFPVGRDEGYFEQLTSEVCVTVYDKIPPYNVWKKKSSGARNEAFDCRVYAYAALCGLISGGFSLDSEAVKMGIMVSAALASLTQPVFGNSNGNRAPRFSMRR